MKVLISVLVVSALVATLQDSAPHKPDAEPGTKLALTCMKSGEMTSGMTKVCYYNCLGSTVAITIKSVQLCPLTINR